MSSSKESDVMDDGFDDDESDYESEYTYTDYSESEDENASSDSGIGSLCRKTSYKNINFPEATNAKDNSAYSSALVERFSSEELRVGEIFRDWTKDILDPDSNIVKRLQDQFGKDLPQCTVKTEEEHGKIVNVIGERDDDGNIHGEAEIFYENGDYFWGDFIHGVKEGSASIVLKNEDNYMGVFRNNKLEGFVTETIVFCDRDNVTREVFYQHGVRHGYYREIGPNKQVWAVGRFSNGKKFGTHWKWNEGNSFLVGALDEDNKPHGDFNIYLYPDLTTALMGHFNHGKLIIGQMVKLDNCRSEGGIPIPEYSLSKGAAECEKYTFDPSTRICISKTPHVQDPYDRRHVYVKESQIPSAGEGLWAKTDIKCGQLVALFNGVREHHVWGAACHTMPWSDYRISLEKDVDLDIPSQHIPVTNYRATLGHKVCHSFINNSWFSPIWHPRFGQVMSVVASRDIMAGEEILVSYNYMIAKSPQWYKDLWFTHLRKDLLWSEHQIYKWACKEVRYNGLHVEIPPP